MTRLYALSLAALFCLPQSSCIGCWQPSSLSPNKVIERESIGEYPKAEVEVLVDNDGIAHIYGASETDLSYGMGYMHGRERRWQVLFNKYASQGRLTELLGADLLEADQFLRLMSLAADRQLAALNDRELALAQSYADGLNTAAAEYGKSAEMRLVGAEWEEFTPYDVVTIGLLFIDQQSPSIRSEVGRNRIRNRIDANDPRFPLLYKRAESGGVPIVTNETHTGLVSLSTPQEPKFKSRAATTKLANLTKSAKAKRPTFSRETEALLQSVLDMEGASNSWVISGDHTESGRPILANDPHLPHGAPGFFYLVHLEHPDYMLSGVTFPGIPAVLIGHGDNVSWGATNANVDCQDLVTIVSPEGRDDVYELDGELVPFETLEQSYKLGSDDDAEVFKETWKRTVFGPLLPPGHEFRIDEGQELAYMWCNDFYADQFDEFFTVFWDLGKAQNMSEVDAAIDAFPGPPINAVFALTNGDIAYRLMGQVPERLSDEPAIGTRDGRFSNAGWGGLVDYERKPQATNPEKGYLMTANQRVSDDDGPLGIGIGGEGHIPYRAQRLTILLDEMLASGEKVNAQQVLDLQRDVKNRESEFLNPVFTRYCPTAIDGHPGQRVAWFCDALRNFDDEFNLQSTGALPYTIIADEFIIAVLETHLGDEDAVNDVKDIPSSRYSIQKEAVRELQGGQSVLFDDPNTPSREGLEHYVVVAAERALERIWKEFGPTPADWRWGNARKAKFKGRLSAAPLFGPLFTTDEYDMPGCPTCVSAEGGFPIDYGSGYRLIAEMLDEPVARQITDSGQSGHFGSDHIEDFMPRWSNYDPITIPLTRASIEGDLEGSLRLLPKP